MLIIELVIYNLQISLIKFLYIFWENAHDPKLEILFSVDQHKNPIILRGMAQLNNLDYLRFSLVTISNTQFYIFYIIIHKH